MQKKLLIIVDKCPTAADNLMRLTFKETIDAALGVAAFGVKVSLWFCGDGIHCLDGSEHLNLVEVLQYYDIDTVYISKRDRLHYNLDAQQFSITTIELSDNPLAAMLNQQHAVLRMN